MNSISLENNSLSEEHLFLRDLIESNPQRNLLLPEYIQYLALRSFASYSSSNPSIIGSHSFLDLRDASNNDLKSLINYNPTETHNKDPHQTERRFSCPDSTQDQNSPCQIRKTSSTGSTTSLLSCDEDYHFSREPLNYTYSSTNRVTQETQVQNLNTVKSISQSDSRIIFNIGGKRYETYKSTILQYPNTFLATMFGTRNQDLTRPDHNGEYFFDRDSEAFSVILNWYRTGKLIIDPKIPLELLRQELDFFQIPVNLDEHVSIALSSTYSAVSGRESKLGPKLARLSVTRAQERSMAILDELIVRVEEGCMKAAEQGCRYCKFDFLKSSSYLRETSGKNNDTLSFQTNVIDKRLNKWLRDKNNLHLFNSRLMSEDLRFTLLPNINLYIHSLVVNLWPDK